MSVLDRELGGPLPDRRLWASNWRNFNRSPAPYNAALLALLHAWIPGPAVRQKILVSNPAQLYWF